MNIDIQTEYVPMRPEWHRMIDDWIARCTRSHPDVQAVDLTLRHERGRKSGLEVAVVANARGRSLRAAKHGMTMTVALHDALDALEHELLVHDAVHRRA